MTGADDERAAARRLDVGQLGVEGEVLVEEKDEAAFRLGL